MRLPKTFFFLTLIFLSTSCIKRYGCHDSNALNYDKKATASDQSCIYESSGAFFFNQQTKSNMLSDGITSITLELDNEIIVSNIDVVSTDVSGYVTCTSTFWFTFNKVIYDDYYNVEFNVYNQNDSLIRSDILLLSQGCHTYQINYP